MKPVSLQQGTPVSGSGWYPPTPGPSSQTGPFRRVKGTLSLLTVLTRDRNRWNCPAGIRPSLSFCNFHTE